MFGTLLEVEMSKKCTRLWREAHFQAKMRNTHQLRTTFGSWDVKKVHAVVARSTFGSEKGKNTSRSEHFWKLRCRKSARGCGAKHISKSKCNKHTVFGTLVEVAMSKKCTLLWHEAHHMLGPLFDVQMSFRVAGARDCAPCQKWAKRDGFVAFPKRWQAWDIWRGSTKIAFSVAGAVQETCSSELLGGQGADFLRRVCILEHQIFRFAGWFCVAKHIGMRPSALHSTFHCWRKSGRIASFLMLSTLKIEEVSQTCFVFDVVKFKNWGSLADFFRFWRCQVQKLRTSRRIAAFSILQLDRQTDRQTDRSIDR